MKSLHQRCQLLFTVLILGACAVEPQPIAYHQDGCHFCKMRISDARYGAELVTDKGKVYKFDAIECLINHKNDQPDQAYAFQLVNTMDSPETLHDATQVTYLISKQLPSPMGMYLTGFRSPEAAKQAQAEYEGEIYSWEELNRSFDDIKATLNQP